MTDRLDREHELSSLAFTDALTGLPNRAPGWLEGLLAGVGRRPTATPRTSPCC